MADVLINKPTRIAGEWRDVPTVVRSGRSLPDVFTEDDCSLLGAVPWGLLIALVTLALGWPLRHDGEMIWTALGAVL